MYEQFFGLREKPFSTVPDTAFLFKSQQHLDAYNHLLYGINEKQGFIVLAGDVGTGKTTLCRALLHELRDSVETALIFNPPATAFDLLTAILQDLGRDSSGTSKKELLDALNAHLLMCSSAGKGVVVIIDEAQNLSGEVLEEVRLLSNLETEKEKLIQIILSGQLELLNKLSQDSLKQLRQRIAIFYHLKPLNKKDVGQYIYYRLHKAGSDGSIAFTRQALSNIYHYSGGIPRKINLICDKALLAGYAAQKKSISARMVQEAIKNTYSEQIPPARLAWQYWIPAAVVVICLCLGIIAAGSGKVLLSWNRADTTLYAQAKAPEALFPVQHSPPRQPAHDAIKNAEPQVQTLPVVRSGAFDSTGVMRQDTAGQCAPEALATLLKLWNVPEENIIREFSQWHSAPAFNFSEMAKAFSFSGVLMDITLDQVKAFDYPCIIPINNTQYRYVVLSGIGSDQVIVMDPLKGKVIITRAEFLKLWQGKAFYVWKEFAEFPARLKRGEVHPAVITLKQKFIEKKFPMKLPITDTFDTRLEEAVKILQFQFGLAVDGIVGNHTRMAFYKTFYSAKLPRLQS